MTMTLKVRVTVRIIAESVEDITMTRTTKNFQMIGYCAINVKGGTMNHVLAEEGRSASLVKSV